MQMIDVMKRLAELDAGNPNIVKESTVAECGMMPMPGMGGSHTPASINMTADSGPELTGMLRDIMQLAGVQQQAPAEPTAMGIEVEPLTAEPIGGIEEPMASAGEKMRSVLDKLNPEPAGDELGSFQGGDEFGADDSQDNDDMSVDQGDVDNDGDHDIQDHEAEEDDEEEETDEGQYDNSPANPNDKSSFDANKFANQENQPGAGNTSSGQERQRNLPTATFEGLMKEYKSFIGEAEEEETDEGIMDKVKAGAKQAAKAVGKAITGPDDEELVQRLEKQTGGKRPSNISTPVKSNESMADILKLSGLRK